MSVAIFSKKDIKFFFNGVATICALGGLLSVYLGYRLFMAGMTAGDGKLDSSAAGIRILLSGQGPGLFFMALGVFAMVAAALSARKAIASDPEQPGKPDVAPNDVTV
jgi:hypothetical protein